MTRATALALVFSGVAAWSMAASGASIQKPADEDMAEYLPPGNGKATVLSECTACHELDRIVPVRQSKQAWKDLMHKLIKEEGAEFSAATMESASTYLGEALGPGAPPLIDVNTASRDQLLKLPGVTPVAADRVIAQRESKGLFTSRDELRAPLGLDGPSFEKFKWFLRVQDKPMPPVRK